MRIVFISNHVFSQRARRASIHFVADALAEAGHDVTFISIGYSRLKRWLGGQIHPAQFELRDAGWRIEGRVSTRLEYPLLHTSNLLHRMGGGLGRLFQSALPLRLSAAALERISTASLIVVESGGGLEYFDQVKRAAPKARFVYFSNDRLDAMGARQWSIALEQLLLPQFDLVRVPAPAIAEGMPVGTRVAVIPHGIDKAAYQGPCADPYPTGTRNIVSVGTMLFDRDIVVELAEELPEAAIHLFGDIQPFDGFENILCHGEVSFLETVPYVRHADAGLAPYMISPKSAYLVESSLKVRQYSFCGLPVIAPSAASWNRPNVFGYDRSVRGSVGGAARAALAHARFPPDDQVDDWVEVASKLLYSIGAITP